MTREQCGVMLRKSRETDLRASSAIAPAISTPVGPPPITTKVSSAWRRAWSVSVSACSSASSTLRRIAIASSMRLEAGRMRGPFVAAEIAVARAGREDQPVIVERARRCRAARCSGRASTPVDLVEQHADVARFGEDRADRRGDVGRRQGGGRDLVEQGLEQVMVAPVDQRDVDGACRPAAWPRPARRSRRRRSRRLGDRDSAHAQCAVQPPSTGSAVPVIDWPPGPHRNTASAPISSTSAKRLFGWAASSTSRITSSRLIPRALAVSSIWFSTSGVQT